MFTISPCIQYVLRLNFSAVINFLLPKELPWEVDLSLIRKFP